MSVVSLSMSKARDERSIESWMEFFSTAKTNSTRLSHGGSKKGFHRLDAFSLALLVLRRKWNYGTVNPFSLYFPIFWMTKSVYASLRDNETPESAFCRLQEPSTKRVVSWTGKSRHDCYSLGRGDGNTENCKFIALNFLWILRLGCVSIFWANRTRRESWKLLRRRVEWWVLLSSPLKHCSRDSRLRSPCEHRELIFSFFSSPRMGIFSFVCVFSAFVLSNAILCVPGRE